MTIQHEQQGWGLERCGVRNRPGALHLPLQFARVGTAAQNYPRRIGLRQRLADIHKSTYCRARVTIKDVGVEWSAVVSKSGLIHNGAVAHQAVHALIPRKGLLGFVW